jgi:hypothetical protein
MNGAPDVYEHSCMGHLPGMLEMITFPPFAKCAKDGAPNHLCLVEISTTKGGPPADPEPFRYIFALYVPDDVFAQYECSCRGSSSQTRGGFVKLGSKLAFLEYKGTCYEPDIKRILAVSVSDPDSLNEGERKYLEDVDQCIRFLYMCTLLAGTEIPLNGKGKVKQFFLPWRLVPKAYYFYLNKLVDEKTERPELRTYVERYFPLLNGWLKHNQVALKSYVIP